MIVYPEDFAASKVRYVGPKFVSFGQQTKEWLTVKLRGLKQAGYSALISIRRYICSHEWHVVGTSKFSMAAEIARSDKILRLKLMTCHKCFAEKIQLSTEGRLVATKKIQAGVEFRIL